MCKFFGEIENLECLDRWGGVFLLKGIVYGFDVIYRVFGFWGYLLIKEFWLEVMVWVFNIIILMNLYNVYGLNIVY